MMKRSTRAARADAVLGVQLKKYFGSAALAEPDSSPLIQTSSRLTALAINIGQTKYAQNPERLQAAIGAADDARNALAVWSGTTDWVVLSSGLFLQLREAAETAASTLSSKETFTSSALAKSLAELEPLAGFTSSYAAALYIAAITFFVGHEIGHHLSGHDGFYLPAGAVAEGASDGVPNSIERQALEIDADAHGVAISQACAARYLIQVVDAREYSDAERKEYQRTLAMLVSLGVFLALAVFQPKAVELGDYRARSHPPSSLRALWISSCLFDAIKRDFSELSENDRRAMRALSLEWAALASISPGSVQDFLLKERGNRNEPSGLRATGIRKAIHDPQSVPYMSELFRTLDALRPRLKPRRISPQK